jgi:uncharacterized repeat protein (TIGR01451 family)/LPXTG-motif cell wall-anchored protein
MSWLRKAGVASIAAGVIVFAIAQNALAIDPNPGVNDQPDVTLPGALTTTPGTPISFTPVVSDPDEHLGDMEMEIDVSDLDGVGGRSTSDYGTFTWGAGTGVTSDVLVAPIADVNTALATFTFTPAASFAGTARIVFEIDDQGNVGSGGVLSRTRFIDIAVAAAGDAAPAVNDQPDITLPGPLVTGVDTPITFAPVVSDIDAAGFPTELEIDISDLDGVGGLSVPAGDYGTFSWGAGTGVTSDVSVTPLSTQNADLATFTYMPATGFVGLARIVFEIDDQGNSGTEFPPNVLSRTRFVDITVVEPADVAVTKAAASTVEPGTSIDYTLAVSNTGPASATDVVLEDVLPPGTTFISVTQTGGPAATLVTPPVGGTGAMTASIASLGAAETATFTLTVGVDGGAVDGTAIVNEATVTTTGFDSDDTNDSDDATTTVDAVDETTTTSTTSTTTSTTPGPTSPGTTTQGTDPSGDDPSGTQGTSAGRSGGSTGRLPATGIASITLVGVGLFLVAAGTVLARRRVDES